MNINDFTLEMPTEGVGTTIHFELGLGRNLPNRPHLRSVVREALLPFLVWRNVPVRVLERRQLGRVEVFLLEAAKVLRKVTLQELSDVTNVPPLVLAKAGAGLVQRGVLVETDSGVFEVGNADIDGLLAVNGIEEERERHVAFAYFPRQDILIAHCDAARQLETAARKLRAPRKAPYVPGVERLENVAEFLARRIEEDRVHGADHRILGLRPWREAPTWAEQSSCYYCTGAVIGEGESCVADLHVWGHKGGKESGPRYKDESVRLPSIVPILQEWIALSDRFGETYEGEIQGLPPFRVQQRELVAPCHWRVGISLEDALALRDRRWLTEPLVVSVCSPTAKVDVRVDLEPDDGWAANLFALDHVAKELEGKRAAYSSGAFSDYLTDAQDRYPLASVAYITRQQVEERLWKMQHFMAVYSLRAGEDFAYG